jgi:ABC-type enterochelin transport system permease subunit
MKITTLISPVQDYSSGILVAKIVAVVGPVLGLLVAVFNLQVSPEMQEKIVQAATVLIPIIAGLVANRDLNGYKKLVENQPKEIK